MLVEAFAGIDLAVAKSKRLPISVCTWRDGALTPFPLRTLRGLAPPRGRGNAAVLDQRAVHDFCIETLNYLVGLEERLGVCIVRVAIDAPSAQCAEDRARRSAEIAMDERRISCFPTPDGRQVELIRARARAHLEAGGAESRIPHANQLWMLLGFVLFQVLGERFECLEVYPQATARTLGVGSIHKRHTSGVEEQLGAVSRYTKWPVPPVVAALKPIAFAPAHDCLDAYLAAWVAALPLDQREACGSQPYDVIWLPRIPRHGT